MTNAEDLDWRNHSDHRPVHGRPLAWLQIYDHEHESIPGKIYLADLVAGFIALSGLLLIAKNL